MKTIVYQARVMLNRKESSKALKAHFQHHKTADLEKLRCVLQTTSRMSVFRRLQEIGYLSSYTHNGRYYTMRDVPDFDENGLWFHEGIGFSKAATLKETAAGLIETSTAGHTHLELESMVRTRVQNILLELIQAGRLRRERIDRYYLYVSADEVRRDRQFDHRRALMVAAAELSVPLPTEVVIAVLVEALHASTGLASAAVVAARLTTRGQVVSVVQAEAVFIKYGLVPGKKTAAPD